MMWRTFARVLSLLAMLLFAGGGAFHGAAAAGMQTGMIASAGLDVAAEEGAGAPCHTGVAGDAPAASAACLALCAAAAALPPGLPPALACGETPLPMAPVAAVHARSGGPDPHPPRTPVPA